MAKFLTIIKEPDPILRKRSDKVSNIWTPDVQKLILDMILTMLKNEGVGIAAPQVGINKRIFIVNTADGPIALINPEITWKSKKTELGEEGCLSIPGVWGHVRRHIKIKVKAVSKKGEKFAFEAEDLFARIIQHETDHIDGILFVDRAEKIYKNDKTK